jgi:dephospho-CoA kinase
MPLVLGVTGSIATGKSHLCQYVVTRFDAVHVDADRLVHRMYDPGKPAFDRIVTEFGEQVVGTDGYIDRKVLGSKVFGNDERMRALTTAIGDIAAEVESVIDGWRAELPADCIAIMEAVNLIEAAYSQWCDATWLVGADAEVALPRLMERNGLSEADARQRLASARPWDVRAPPSDRVFLNNGAVEAFEAEIDAAVTELMASWRAGAPPRSRWHDWWEATREEREERERERAASRAQH